MLSFIASDLWRDTIQSTELKSSCPVIQGPDSNIALLRDFLKSGSTLKEWLYRFITLQSLSLLRTCVWWWTRCFPLSSAQLLGIGKRSNYLSLLLAMIASDSSDSRPLASYQKLRKGQSRLLKHCTPGLLRHHKTASKRWRRPKAAPVPRFASVRASRLS